MSINGLITKEDSDIIDWTCKEDKEFFKNMTMSYDSVMLMGRKTFESLPTGLTLSLQTLKNRKILVLSKRANTDQKLDLNYNQKDIIFSDKKIEEIIEELGKNSVKNLFICGGQSVYSYVIEHELFDDIFLTIEPTLFAHGLPFIGNIRKNINLQLTEIIRLNSNSIIIHYKKI